MRNLQSWGILESCGPVAISCKQHFAVGPGFHWPVRFPACAAMLDNQNYDGMNMTRGGMYLVLHPQQHLLRAKGCTIQYLPLQLQSVIHPKVYIWKMTPIGQLVLTVLKSILPTY